MQNNTCASIRRQGRLSCLTLEIWTDSADEDLLESVCPYFITREPHPSGGARVLFLHQAIDLRRGKLPPTDPGLGVWDCAAGVRAWLQRATGRKLTDLVPEVGNVAHTGEAANRA